MKLSSIELYNCKGGFLKARLAAKEDWIQIGSWQFKLVFALEDLGSPRNRKIIPEGGHSKQIGLPKTKVKLYGYVYVVSRRTLLTT